MNEEYKQAFTDIARGLYKLGICLWHTFRECVIDIAKFAVKHPLALLIIVASIWYSFYTTATARVERDSLARQSYAQEVKIDSLELIINK